jgi:hypothetical protein
MEPFEKQIGNQKFKMNRIAKFNFHEVSEPTTRKDQPTVYPNINFLNGDPANFLGQLNYISFVFHF